MDIRLTNKDATTYKNKHTYSVYDGTGRFKKYLGYAEFDLSAKVYYFWDENTDLGKNPNAMAYTQKIFKQNIENYYNN